MNCLTEAIGLALPGSGTTVATHTARKASYEQSGRPSWSWRRYYDQGDAGVLPRSIASRAPSRTRCRWTSRWAGPPTRSCICWPSPRGRTGLHLADIDARSRDVPCICKVAPSGTYLMEDVHRAGGIPAILGELNRAGLLNRTCTPSTPPRSDEWLGKWDVRGGSPSPEAVELFHAAPGGVRSAGGVLAVEALGRSLDLGRREGLHPRHRPRLLRRRRAGHPARQPVRDGCVVKTAGVDASILTFSGPGGGRRVAGGGGRGDPGRTGQARRRRRGPLRRAARRSRACRRCSTPPRTSRAGAWARSARWSPTAASPAARRGCRSATSRPRRPRAARSRWSRTATRSHRHPEPLDPAGRAGANAGGGAPASSRTAATSPAAASGSSRRHCAPTRPWPCRPTRAPFGTWHLHPSEAAYRVLAVFSATRNSTTRRIRSLGSGWPSGNWIEPFPCL
jgi:hypothetical protein